MYQRRAVIHQSRVDLNQVSSGCQHATCVGSRADAACTDDGRSRAEPRRAMLTVVCASSNSGAPLKPPRCCTFSTGVGRVTAVFADDSIQAERTQQLQQCNQLLLGLIG